MGVYCDIVLEVPSYLLEYFDDIGTYSSSVVLSHLLGLLGDVSSGQTHSS